MKLGLGAALIAALAFSSHAAAEWKYGETADAITDKKYARTVAEGDTGTIIVKCDAPGPDSIYLHYVSKEYLGGRGGRPAGRDLTVRFDADEPITKNWIYDGRSAILTEDAQVWPLIHRLETAKKMAVRAQTYEYAPVTSVIDVENATASIAQVVKACEATRK